MTRIGLLSDTHAYLDERIFHHFENCDEIWHAGDIGSLDVVNRLRSFAPLRAVHGNIDGQDIRYDFPEFLTFECEGIKVLMTHIGGFPGKYDTKALRQIFAVKPKIFVCGHSHILKIQYDNTWHMLSMNPGAAGKQGWHTVQTLLRFVIDGDNIQDLEVIELERQ